MFNTKMARFFVVLLIGTMMLASCGQAGSSPSGAETENAASTASVEDTSAAAETRGSVIEISEEKQGTIYDDSALYTDEAKEQQAKFDQYLAELFKDEVTNSTIDLHFTIQQPENYGIERFPATWGELDLDELLNAAEESEEELGNLHAYSYDMLNYEQRLTYDILEHSLELSAEVSENFLLEEVFSPLSGIQTQIPILFSEYQLVEKQDIEDCLTLLETVDEYFDFLISFERMRAEQGYFLSEESVDTVVEQCRDFLSGDENCILTVLRDRINSFEGLTPEEIDAYVQRAAEAVENGLVTAYSHLIDALLELQGSRKVPDGLAQYEGGADYYCLLLQGNVGTSRTPEELIDMTERQMQEDMTEIYALLMQDQSILEKLDSYEFFYSDPEETLNYLSENLGEDFPEPVVKDYSLKYVHEAMETLETPAYYMIPPVDNWQDNTIYVNRNPEYAHMDLFTTLAHEGFPGHLYQTTYNNSLQLDPIRQVLNYTGYSEGWATYIEIQYGYSLGMEDQKLARVLALNTSYNQGIYTRVDLGVNYEGWTREDVASYLQELGITDSDIVDELFETLAADPAVYPAYYIGYLEIMNLRELALAQGVSTYDFHKFLLEVGEAPFDIIEERMLEYFGIESSETIQSEESSIEEEIETAAAA